MDGVALVVLFVLLGLLALGHAAVWAIREAAHAALGSVNGDGSSWWSDKIKAR